MDAVSSLILSPLQSHCLAAFADLANVLRETTIVGRFIYMSIQAQISRGKTQKMVFQLLLVAACPL